MSSVAESIFRRYGLLAIIVAIVLSFALWFFAHMYAAPKTEVSILWGLVRYTKASTSDAASPSRIEDSSGSRQPSLSANIQPFPLAACVPVTNSPIVLKIISGSVTSDWNSVICTLRRQRDLRELLASESGKTVRELPTGTYCFASSVSSMLFATDLSNISVDRYAGKGWGGGSGGSLPSLEIHLLQQGPELLMFMSETDAASIAKLSGQDTLKVTASSRPEGTMQSLVMIPYNRVVSRRSRFVQASADNQSEVIDVELR